MAFLHRMDRPVTFLKAATYLMHRNAFSVLRAFILEGTAAVLEDDSPPLFEASAPRNGTLSFSAFTRTYSEVQGLQAEGSAGGLPWSGRGGPSGFRHRVPAPRGRVHLLLATRRAQ